MSEWEYLGEIERLRADRERLQSELAAANEDRLVLLAGLKDTQVMAGDRLARAEKAERELAAANERAEKLRLTLDVSQDVLSTAEQWHKRRCLDEKVHDHALLRRLQAIIASNEALLAREALRSTPAEPHEGPCCCHCQHGVSTDELCEQCRPTPAQEPKPLPEPKGWRWESPHWIPTHSYEHNAFMTRCAHDGPDGFNCGLSESAHQPGKDQA